MANEPPPPIGTKNDPTDQKCGRDRAEGAGRESASGRDVGIRWRATNTRDAGRGV